MTLNRPRSSSHDFSIKYIEYADRHNVGHNRGQIGNHLWTCDWPMNIDPR